MKTAYMTGATGCVGHNLVDELLKDQWDIVVLHRKSSDLSELKNKKVRFQEVDLYSLDSVCQSLPEGIEVLFHIAGNTSHWFADRERQWKDNVLVTRNLVEAALKRKVKKFIFTSTGATNKIDNLDERLVMQEPNGYIRTKRLAELEVFKGVERGLFAIIIKPIIVVGSYDYHNYAQIFNDLKSRRLHTALPGRIVFCHARDVARAHILAYEKGRNGEMYTLDGYYTTWLDFFQRAAKKVGAPIPTTVTPKWQIILLGHLYNVISLFTHKKPPITPELARLLDDAPDVTTYDKKKLREELGYTSRPFEDMIDDCYEWLKQQGKV